MRSIGELARDSGLGVSALRFYDRSGVLMPARVDPATGYRWYGPEQLGEARVLTRLRRAGMPLADIRLVLAGWSGTDTGRDTGLVRGLLDGHLRRLESGLADARLEFSAIRALLEPEGNTTMTTTTAATTATPATAARLTVPATELAAALDAVRFAAGKDPELPVLGGVHFDIEGQDLHVVATDRYRMAVARTSTTGHDGARVQVTVPSPLVDAMRALLTDGSAPARLTVTGGRVELETQGREVAGRGLGEDFPDYRRLTRLPEGRRVPLDVPALRRALTDQAEAAEDVCTLLLTADTVTVAAEDDLAPVGERVGVNPAFLLEALAADELLLEYVGPKAPLVLLRPATEDTFSLLMPVSLDA
ncbi:MerR family transcriptional regulator [Streptomyces sp. NBC_00536]|uniref:DNA polymerase III subunit beta family protein n=1 Tax=Streptomyces sp. NBC_00536 TaxID=2975769 RepID=UPI002E803BF9|nr:MerR family transcriptional regulator [Streptomyces sp. NBC_00536]WUC83826.1 MerR family transcriptional regulator [Streptomyces sp. NBC_00536]